MREALWRAIARAFPTERIATSRPASTAWRVLFYLFRPQEPFPMRLERYTLLADPARDTLTRAVIRRGYWERPQTEAFAARVPVGGFVIDAGANFGHFALTAASLVGPDGHVVAFEPEPRIHAALARNVALQPHGNLTAERLGLGDAPARLDLVSDKGNPGGHSFLPGSVRDAGEVQVVEVVTLDDYLAEHQPGRRVDLVKIDVQGLEGGVVRGAARTIARHRPIVFCEVTPGDMAQAGDDASELVGFFLDLGYRAHVFEADGKLVPAGDVEARLMEASRPYLDWVFEPG